MKSPSTLPLLVLLLLLAFAGHSCVAAAASNAHLVLLSFDTSRPAGAVDAFTIAQSNPVSAEAHVASTCPDLPFSQFWEKTMRSSASLSSSSIPFPPQLPRASSDGLALRIYVATDTHTFPMGGISEASLRACHATHHASHHHDHILPDGSFAGGRADNTLLILPFVMPAHMGSAARTVQLEVHQQQQPSSEVQHRHLHTLSYSTSTRLVMEQRGINVSTVQQTNPRRTRSITFVSAGYRATERSAFAGHVQAAVDALRGASSGGAVVDADPWPRYMSTLNLYSVFEPSLESGASRPHQPGHDCKGMTVCGPTSVQNNLRCTYGSPKPSLLFCDRAAVLSLASFSNVVDIVVVLINDVDYGGTGGGKVATLVAASALMPSLLVHELSHAVAGLGDEYSYGFADTDPVLPNCAATNDARRVPWSDWITAKLVDTTPSKGCTYDNLYRPTATGCLMHTTAAPGMCQVCKETLTTALYNGGVGLALDEPRCPPAGFELVVAATASVPLFVNHRFTIFNPNVNVTWLLHDGTVLHGIPSVSIAGSQLVAGANIVTAFITDRTTSLKPNFGQAAGANYSSTFVLRRETVSNVNCQTLQCTSSTGAVTNYCGTCTTDKCLNDTIISPVTHVSASKADIEQAKQNIFIVAVVVSCTGFGLLLVVLIVWYCNTQRTTQPILALSGGDVVLLRLSTVCAVVVLVLVSIALVFAVKYFPQTIMFGNELFVSLLVIGSFVFLIAIANAMAAVAHWTVLMYICATCVFLISLGMFAVGIAALYVRENFQTSTLQDAFASRWREEASSHPSVICTIQSALDCSGYQRGCFPLPSSYCPRNCDEPNQNPNGCKTIFEDWVNQKLLPIAVITLICAFFFLVSSFVACIASSRYRRARASTQSRRTYRKDPRAPVPAITEPEMTIFKKEFSKTDRQGTGYLRGEELATFVKEVFDEELAPSDKIALETGGPMSADQVLKLYFPHMDGVATDPRQLTLEEAEEAADPVHLQQLQYAKMELFMVASGALSPEALFSLFRDFRRVSFTTTGKEFIDVMRKAAKEYERTEDADMCRGLSPQDLEGLRCAWVAIHPQVVGALSDAEVDRFYQWTHGAPLHTHEQFVRWKEMLDVRSSGVIGWTEFCFPFAQRALVQKARAYLVSVNRTVEVETLTRAEVAEEFGPVIADTCFLPYERSVPIERALEVAMRFQY